MSWYVTVVPRAPRQHFLEHVKGDGLSILSLHTLYPHHALKPYTILTAVTAVITYSALDEELFGRS